MFEKNIFYQQRFFQEEIKVAAAQRNVVPPTQVREMSRVALQTSLQSTSCFTSVEKKKRKNHNRNVKHARISSRESRRRSS